MFYLNIFFKLIHNELNSCEKAVEVDYQILTWLTRIGTDNIDMVPSCRSLLSRIWDASGN